MQGEAPESRAYGYTWSSASAFLTLIHLVSFSTFMNTTFVGGRMMCASDLWARPDKVSLIVMFPHSHVELSVRNRTVQCYFPVLYSSHPIVLSVFMFVTLLKCFQIQ